MSKATHEPDVPPAPPPLWRQRCAVVVACPVLLLVLVIALAGASSMIALGQVIREGMLIGLWLLAAAGYGYLLPLPSGERGQSLRVVSAIAIGIGIISLLQLGLGLAGQLHRAVAWVVIVVGIALLVFRCRKLRGDDLVRWANAQADWDWLWLLAVPPLAIAIVAALVPPGMLWGDEPNGYDVVEYHLQIPREWYEAHRIMPLNHNVFSYFPQGMEMSYLLAMQLRRSAWGGMYLAQLMHVAVCALSVVAIYATARQFAPKASSMLAAIAAAYVPWMMLLAPVAYNEGGLLLFGTLAIGWCLHGTTRGWLAGGVMTGFACGVKLTAAPQVLVLLPLIVAVVALIQKEQLTSVLRGVAMFVISGLIVFSPWLIRNVVWARNPVFPEAQQVLGRAHFSEVQSKRWHDAHSPRPDQRALSARLHEAWEQIGRDGRYAYLPLLGIACALIAIRRPHAWVFIALLGAWLVFWLAFTHLQSRFFVLGIPVAALSIALLKERWQLPLAGAVVLTEILLGLNMISVPYRKSVQPFCDGKLLCSTDLTGLLRDEVVPLVMRQESIALVGDAKAFFYSLPPGKLHYRTVFDVDVKPGQSVADAWLEGVSGSPHIVVDPMELDRFHKTYYGIPALPDDFPGSRDEVFIAYPQRPPAPTTSPAAN